MKGTNHANDQRAQTHAESVVAASTESTAHALSCGLAARAAPTSRAFSTDRGPRAAANCTESRSAPIGMTVVSAAAAAAAAEAISAETPASAAADAATVAELTFRTT